MTADLDRREFLVGTAAALGTASCQDASGTKQPPKPQAVSPAHTRTAANEGGSEPVKPEQEPNMPENAAKMPTVRVEKLRFPWQTPDPFLFCVHHLDRYPHGDERMGPAVPLTGRNMGSDFSGKDGWSMYHGDIVPGFPRHPHRGFETVTVARQGHIDHSDSLGATARFGQGDAQWMTAGRGIVHSEMFPLRDRNAPNTAELFQLWLNLPQKDKMVEPHFTMFWHETIPRHRFTDAAGRVTQVTTVAGALEGKEPPKPPPHSWASDPQNGVAIWTIELAPEAEWSIPAATNQVNRNVYFYEGQSITIAGLRVREHSCMVVEPTHDAPMKAGPDGAKLLMLQGAPIGEPIARHGPFVMNTRTELQQAYMDYQRTQFGGWPWKRMDPVHAREQGRFAIHADGRRDVPT